MLSHLFGEVFGLLFPFGVSYAVTKYIAFAPLLSPGVKIPDSLAFLPASVFEFVKANNEIAISLIPSLIYVIGRIYFESMFFVRSLIPNPLIAKYVSYAQTWIGILGPFFHPSIQNVIVDIFNDQFGNIGTVVYDLSKPEVIKSVEFGKKLGLLIVGWFALFLIIEIVLRIVFFILIFLYNLIVGKKGNTDESSDDSKPNN